MTTTTTPAGNTVDPKGPPTVAVRKVMDAARHTRSVPAKKKNGIPSVGYTIRKHPGDAYVEVSATMGGLVETYRKTLTKAGFVVEDTPRGGRGLAVYAAPKN